MDTVTIKKSELKSLIQETLKEYFPKYNFVSDKEQAEIESIYKNDEFNKRIEVTHLTKQLHKRLIALELISLLSAKFSTNNLFNLKQ